MSIRDTIAAYIRTADADNELSPHQLAESISAELLHRRAITPGQADAVEDFAYELNRGAGYRKPKPYGPDALAEAIINRFHLD